MRSQTYNVTTCRVPMVVAPAGPEGQQDTQDTRLRVVVLYRTPTLTREALEYASRFGDGLRVDLRLLEIEVVPFPCPLERPLIDPNFARRRLETLVQESGFVVKAELVYARDRDEALKSLLGMASVVLIPVRGFWQRIRERGLVRKLMKHGHDVVLVPCK